MKQLQLDARGALEHVSASANGTVWRVNRNDEIYGHNLGSSVNLSMQVPGALGQISVGARNLSLGCEQEHWHIPTGMS